MTGEPDTWTWPDAYADWPWPPEPEVDSESFLATCPTCGELYRKSAGLGVQCQECQWATDNIDPDEEHDDEGYCPACGGTGEVPDNGTNMGECDECNR